MNVEPYDHCRASGDDDLPSGVYRVVGVDGGDATLLLVADADGSRVRSGRVEQVPASTVESLAEAENPDADPGVVRRLAGVADGLAWALRSGVRRLAP